MFDIAPSELLVLGLVALLVVGPKDLPRLMRAVGQWVRRGRAMAMQFRAGFEQMMHEADLADERAKYQAAQAQAQTADGQDALAQPYPAQTYSVQGYDSAADAAPQGSVGTMADEAAAADPSSVTAADVHAFPQPEIVDNDRPDVTDQLVAAPAVASETEQDGKADTTGGVLPGAAPAQAVEQRP